MGGGYRFGVGEAHRRPCRRPNHPPGEITLERVVRVFQGQLAPIACATRSSPEPCPMDAACSLREVWQEVRNATIEILESVDFAMLAERAGGAWVNPSLLSLPTTAD